jgi:hypothetical protein
VTEQFTEDELEARFCGALEAVRRHVDAGLGDAGKTRIGWDTIATFLEDAGGGYSGIEQTFDDVVRIAARRWGTPSKVGVAFWSNPVVVATVAMLPHDADSLRSFELRMAVPMVA